MHTQTRSHRRPCETRPTSGDFPHARRGSRPSLMCGATTTTCCFTILVGGVGGLAGFVAGIRKAIVTRAEPAPSFSLPLAYAAMGCLLSPLSHRFWFENILQAYAHGGGIRSADTLSWLVSPALFLLLGIVMAALAGRGIALGFNRPIAAVGRFVFVVLIYSAIGVCIGAAIGFGIDSVPK